MFQRPYMATQQQANQAMNQRMHNTSDINTNGVQQTADARVS